MSTRPKWLPEEINCKAGIDLFRKSHETYQRDFNRPLFLNGRKIYWDRRQRGKFQEAFWHLVTQDCDSGTGRSFNERRARRIGWCRAVIENCNAEEVLRLNGEDVYLWVRSVDYVVILSRREGDMYFLVTAFVINNESRITKVLESLLENKSRPKRVESLTIGSM